MAKTDLENVTRLRKAIMSAATLLQEVPEGELPDADTLDFIDSDLRAAHAALAAIEDSKTEG